MDNLHIKISCQKHIEGGVQNLFWGVSNFFIKIGAVYIKFIHNGGHNIVSLGLGSGGETISPK